MNGLITALGEWWIGHIRGIGRMTILLKDVLLNTFTPPFRPRLIVSQMEYIGVRSLFVIVLTGTFTGMVLALQSFHAFSKFNAESLVGATVALSLARELGPVLTAILVTARAGSAMAAELGTMRVTEQIDAMTTMAVDPVDYLIVPRILASLVMVPLLTVVFNFSGIIGGYAVGVTHLHISGGALINKMIDMTDLQDLTHGLYKSVVFGLLLSLIGCYKGFTATRGAEGVGRATTEAVVLSAVLILVTDYFLTDILF